MLLFAFVTRFLLVSVVLAAILSSCSPAPTGSASCPERPSPNAKRIFIALGGAPRTEEARPRLLDQLIARLNRLTAPGSQGATVTLLRVSEHTQDTVPQDFIFPPVPALEPTPDARVKNLIEAGAERTQFDARGESARACARDAHDALKDLGSALRRAPSGSEDDDVWAALSVFSDAIAGLSDPSQALILIVAEDEGFSARQVGWRGFPHPDFSDAGLCCPLFGTPVYWLGLHASDMVERDDRTRRWRFWLVDRMGAGRFVVVLPNGEVPTLPVGES